MKKLSSLLIAFALIGAIITGCEEEPPAPASGPTIAVNSGSGNVVDAADVPINTEFIVSIITVAGDADITEIEVQENGTAIAASRVSLDGSAAGGNPSPIGANFASGFNWDIGIVTSDVVDATNTYTIKITDANGLSDELSVSITQINALTETTMVLLKNQGGPTGTGGLDLNTGSSTGTDPNDDPNAVDADIRDLGIDINLPLDQNWRQKIGTINGSEIAVPDASFDFDAVASTAQLEAAFELGTKITETAEKVAVDDVYLVKSDGVFFAIKVTAVNVTPADNDDNYELSVKQ